MVHADYVQLSGVIIWMIHWYFLIILVLLYMQKSFGKELSSLVASAVQLAIKIASVIIAIKTEFMQVCISVDLVALFCVNT